MNYTLHQLYVFLKVAQNDSITAAVDATNPANYTVKEFSRSI
jgi:hypothetical protein